MQRSRANVSNEQRLNIFELHRQNPNQGSNSIDRLNPRPIPLFNDPDVRAKISKFYDNLNSLQCNVQCTSYKSRAVSIYNSNN